MGKILRIESPRPGVNPKKALYLFKTISLCSIIKFNVKCLFILQHIENKNAKHGLITMTKQWVRINV
jgi:hypothetical protein